MKRMGWKTISSLCEVLVYVTLGKVYIESISVDVKRCDGPSFVGGRRVTKGNKDCTSKLVNRPNLTKLAKDVEVLGSVPPINPTTLYTDSVGSLPWTIVSSPVVSGTLATS